MEKRAIAITVGTVITGLLVAFLILCTVLFWQNKDKQDAAYDDGYNAGIEDKTTLQIEITELKKDKAALAVQLAEASSALAASDQTIESLREQKAELRSQVTTLSATKEANELEITRLSVLKTENENKINELSALNATQAEQIAQHLATIATNEAKITALQNANADYTTEIDALKEQLTAANADKAALQQQISVYEATIEQNNLQIASLQATKTELQSRIADLTANNEQNNATIANLQAQIASLNDQIVQLTTTNSTNVATIAQLNTQISTLSTRINELSALNVSKSQKMADLNSQIVKLNNYILGYEQFLSSFESDTQAIAIFEHAGSLYSIQLVTNGGCASVPDPADTEYVVFCGWTVAGDDVDVASYPITTNTKFVSKITRKYDVLFIADDTTVSSQIVASGAAPTAVSTPTKAGYRFLGWTQDGTTTVDPTTTLIAGATTYTALYVQQFTVRFVDEGVEISSETVDKNTKVASVERASDDNKIFNGWTVNGIIVDVSSYPITQDTTFVASYTYKYDVTYIVDDVVVSSQKIVKGAYSTAPATPTKDGYEFTGWKVGDLTVTPATYAITANTTFVAGFDLQKYAVSFYETKSATPTVVTVYAGATLASAAPSSPTRDRLVFDGWGLLGSTTPYSATTLDALTVTDNISLYAFWHYGADGTFVYDETNAECEDGYSPTSDFAITITKGIVTSCSIADAVGSQIEDGYYLAFSVASDVVYKYEFYHNGLEDWWVFSKKVKSPQEIVESSYLIRTAAASLSYILD